MAQPPPTSIMYIFTCLFSQHYGRSQLVMYGKFCNHFRWMTTFGVIPIEDALAFCMHFATCDHCFLRVAATLCLDRQDATTNLHSTVCTMSPLIDRQEEIAGAPHYALSTHTNASLRLMARGVFATTCMSVYLGHVDTCHRVNE